MAEEINTEKGVIGLKQADFKTPKEFFGSEFGISDELPEGIRLYIRGQAVPIGAKSMVVDVYRLIDDGGLKNKKSFCFKMNNRRPEDSEIAERCGPGSYVWMGKWLGPDGREKGVISDAVEIGEEAKGLHDAYLKKLAGAGVVAGDIPVTPSAASSPSTMGFTEILKIMELAEEKTIARMERFAAIFQGNKQETPGEVLKAAYEGASDMMSKAMDFNLAATKKVTARALKEMDPVEDAEGDESEDLAAADAGPAVPEWMAGFMPFIKTGMEKLLGGGPMGSAVKHLIISSDEWKEIFKDPEKWGQAVAAMEMNFGSERTTKALDVLLNRRKESKKQEAKKKTRK